MGFTTQHAGIFDVHATVYR